MTTTDRQIIERLLIPALMQVVVTGIRQGLGDDAGVLEPVSTLLNEALREPVADLLPERAAKLVRRAKRTTTAAMAPLADKLTGVQYLAIARFTADLAERDMIAVGAESPFARAWDMMAEIVDLGGDELARHDPAAGIAAQELGRVLGELGFFRTG